MRQLQQLVKLKVATPSFKQNAAPIFYMEQAEGDCHSHCNLGDQSGRVKNC